jgi:prevent-host-death family protein
MANVSIRDLRNKGGEIVDRAAHGESITITRDGEPVAQLRPVARPGLVAEVLLDRWRHLPPLDPRALRREIDDAIDPHL